MIPHSNAGQRIWRLITRLILLAAVGAGVAIPLAGQGEFLGSGAFALLVVAVLVDLATMSSYAADKTSRNSARFMWVVVALLCLGLTLFIAGLDHPDAEKDAGTILVLAMTILSAPLGFIGFPAGGLLANLFSHHQSVAIVSTWLVLTALGYLQWFVLVPWLWRKWKARRARVGRISEA